MRIPLATYRLQFSASFRFRDARALVPYLARLGISDIYASPIFQARAGSTHGYDVTDPGALNPELGTQEDFEALVAEVQAHGMGWLQDIVPNHMAYSSDNRMLMDVFENGPQSRFYEFFDIFRDHPDPELQRRVLAPFLAGPLEEVLQRGELRLVLDADGLAVRYFDWRFPLCLSTYQAVLGHGDGKLAIGAPNAEYRVGDPGAVAGDDPKLQAFAGLRDTFVRLSDTEDSPEKREQLDQARRLLWQLYNDDAMVNVYLDGVLAAFNHPAEGPMEQSPLYILLEKQVYKLVPWPVAYEQINYRRFFYISDFIALRVQDPKVFETVHRQTVELTQAGVFTGLRIDHVDGLYNPRGYLARLHKALPDCYLIVEKILELYEFLRTEWPIQGTSGYKFCNYVNGLFCRQNSEEAFTRIYHRFIGSEPDYEQLLYEEKKKILEWRMGGEIAYLTHLALQLAPSDDPQAPAAMKQAMTALMAAFPVYRTYVDAYHFSEQDSRLLIDAFKKARARCADCGPAVDRVVELLLPNVRDESDPVLREARRNLLMRFQQFTGPAMAKGFEDTLLYVYNRFLALNEVGGNPRTFGLPLETFHEFNQGRARDWPHAMSALSTHDSKRGEDVRARLNVLSEIPERWEQAVTRWARMNESHKQPCDRMLAPHRNDEYLLYQTLVGALPWEPGEHAEFPQRIKDYLIKAVREAKTYTNWAQPNKTYEEACTQFVERILDRSSQNCFWADFAAFQKEIAEYGIYNSLAQTTLKMTCPGLPDFYQGTELWDLSLVDPDNRRPVDFEKRASLLREITGHPAGGWRAQPTLWPDGQIKMWLILKGLQARRENKELFDHGDYVPASVRGSRTEHLVAFFRVLHAMRALIVVPRFVTSLVRPGQLPVGQEVWQDTRIDLPPDAPAEWRDAITGSTLSTRGELPVGDILSQFPVSILLNGRDGGQ